MVKCSRKVYSVFHSIDIHKLILVPGPPADIKVVISSPQSLLVSWLPPFEPNGVITNYNLYKRSINGKLDKDQIKQIISNQHTNFEVKSIQPLIEYQFWVTGSTKVGEGQNSRIVSQITTSRSKCMTLTRKILQYRIILYNFSSS